MSGKFLRTYIGNFMKISKDNGEVIRKIKKNALFLKKFKDRNFVIFLITRTNYLDFIGKIPSTRF